MGIKDKFAALTIVGTLILGTSAGADNIEEDPDILTQEEQKTMGLLWAFTRCLIGKMKPIESEAEKAQAEQNTQRCEKAYDTSFSSLEKKIDPLWQKYGEKLPHVIQRTLDYTLIAIPEPKQ